MDDPFNLTRFVEAQNPVIDRVLSELRSGSKRGHWIWFIFPQLKGLGTSSMSNCFGISSLGEAEAYVQHPILNSRLEDCTAAVNQLDGLSAEAIFGWIDAVKFRSSMTLFSRVASTQIFKEALQKYFGGKSDQATLDRLK